MTTSENTTDSTLETFFSDPQNVLHYANKARRTARFMYSTCLSEIATLNISGCYLDVGAGPGVLATLVAQQHPDVQITALEPAPQMVSYGKDYVTEQGLADRITFVTGNANDPALLNTLGTFDLVYCTYTLHFFQQPETVIHNLLNTLNTGGILYFFDLRRVEWITRLPLNSGTLNAIRTSYDIAEVQAILQRAGIADYDIAKHFPFGLSVIIRRS